MQEVARAHQPENDQGEAEQVEHIRLTLALKAIGCQPVESTHPLSKFWFSDVDLHPCTKAAGRDAAGSECIAQLERTFTAGTMGGG